MQAPVSPALPPLPLRQCWPSFEQARRNWRQYRLRRQPAGRHCSLPCPVLAKPATPACAPEIRMSTTNGGPQPQMAMPQIAVLAQYVKDLSFENPHAPRSLAPSTQQPTINIQVNVEAAPASETDFEVTLRLEGKAESDGLR